MGKQNIYLNDWLAIHPYTAVQQSDTYFVKLANRLYDETAASIPYEVSMDMCLYAAAFLDDFISGCRDLGLSLDDIQQRVSRRVKQLKKSEEAVHERRK